MVGVQKAWALPGGTSHWAAEAKSVTSAIPGGPAVCGYLAPLPAEECASPFSDVLGFCKF